MSRMEERETRFELATSTAASISNATRRDPWRGLRPLHQAVGFNTPIARLHYWAVGVEKDVRKDVKGRSRWGPRRLLGWNPNTNLGWSRAACPARVAAS